MDITNKSNVMKLSNHVQRHPTKMTCSETFVVPSKFRMLCKSGVRVETINYSHSKRKKKKAEIRTESLSNAEATRTRRSRVGG